MHNVKVNRCYMFLQYNQLFIKKNQLLAPPALDAHVTVDKWAGRGLP